MPHVIYVPKESKTITEAAHSRVIAMVAAWQHGESYEKNYDRLVTLLSITHELERLLQARWREVWFDWYLEGKLKPPFEEMYWIDDAQKQYLAPYYRYKMLADKFEKLLKTAMTRTIAVIKPPANGRYFVVRQIGDYLSMGMNAPRYRRDEADGLLADLRRFGIRCKTAAASKTKWAGQYGAQDMLVLASAKPWQIDYALRYCEKERIEVSKAEFAKAGMAYPFEPTAEFLRAG